MSAALIAVVLALVLDHAAPPLVQLRQYGWFERWLAWLSPRAGNSLFTSRFGIVLSLGPLLVGIGLVQWALALHFFGLPGFVFSLAVLFYCWGPRDLDVDVAAVIDADDAEHRQVAIQRLVGDGAPLPQDDQPALVEAVFEGALLRWFGVLLWFLLLGPFGAVLYRFAQLGSRPAATAHLPGEHADAYRRLAAILDWPAAQLMALALALAGNFDAVFGAWRDWHAAHRAQGAGFDHGFLGAAGCAGVNRDLAEAREDAVEAVDVVAADWSGAVVVADAMSLVWRVLLVWLAVLALFVLAGFVD